MSNEQQRDDNPERGTRRVPRSVIVGLAVVAVVALGGAIILGANARAESEAASIVAAKDASEGDAAPFTMTADGGKDALDAGEPPSTSSAAESPVSSDPEDEAQPDAALADADGPLPALDTVPASAVGMIALPDGFEAATFQVEFSPYGWGPGGSAGGNLVIEVDAAELLDGDAEGIEDYTGKTLSVWVSAEDAAAMAGGGEYTGVVEIRKQGDVGWLFISAIFAK